MFDRFVRTLNAHQFTTERKTMKKRKKNKKQIAKEKQWRRQVLAYSRDRWEETVGSITDKYLRRKVACIVWWDCYKQEEDEDLSYLVKEMRMYAFDSPKQEKYGANNLIRELIRLGYPSSHAHIRILNPSARG